jgi:hypothetical protein
MNIIVYVKVFFSILGNPPEGVLIHKKGCAEPIYCSKNDTVIMLKIVYSIPGWVIPFFPLHIISKIQGLFR